METSADEITFFLLKWTFLSELLLETNTAASASTENDVGGKGGMSLATNWKQNTPTSHQEISQHVNDNVRVIESYETKWIFSRLNRLKWLLPVPLQPDPNPTSTATFEAQSYIFATTLQLLPFNLPTHLVYLVSFPVSSGHYISTCNKWHTWM